MQGSRSPLAVSMLTIASALVVCVAAFLPWYQTAIGPINAPDAVSGWDASLLARLAVAGAAICALCATVVALDVHEDIALHGPVRRILAGTCLAAAIIVCAAVLFRLVEPPDPAIGATRELGLALATIAAILGLYGAMAQFSRTFPEPRQHRAPRRRRTRSTDGPGVDLPR
jgi:hypothetical protein